MSERAVCPHCNGNLKTAALVNRGAAGCTWEEIQCITCHGSGTVDSDWLARTEEAKAAGKVLRAERLERGESIARAAGRLSMSLAEYSRLERGWLS